MSLRGNNTRAGLPETRIFLIMQILKLLKYTHLGMPFYQKPNNDFSLSRYVSKKKEHPSLRLRRYGKQTNYTFILKVSPLQIFAPHSIALSYLFCLPCNQICPVLECCCKVPALLHTTIPSCVVRPGPKRICPVSGMSCKMSPGPITFQFTCSSVNQGSERRLGRHLPDPQAVRST